PWNVRPLPRHDRSPRRAPTGPQERRDETVQPLGAGGRGHGRGKRGRRARVMVRSGRSARAHGMGSRSGSPELEAGASAPPRRAPGAGRRGRPRGDPREDDRLVPGRPMTSRRWFLRAPLTTCLDLAVLAIALFNGSARAELVPFAAQAWGFDPFQIDLARWPTLVTGVFLVRNPPMLVGILVFLALSVGVYEARYGTGRAATLFGLSHVVTLLATTALLVYPMHFAGMPRLSDWA